MRRSLVLVAGAVFGAGLAVAGMTDPARIVGFLDIAGTWDPTLALVMGGALAAFAATHRALAGGGGGAPVGPVWASAALALRDRRLLIGMVMFGAGWGLGGMCPGPAIANLIEGHGAVLAFVPAMLVGMLIAQRGFGADSST
ncbi:MAG: YeeE/YedE family protein [Planctomycetes bacterium]|nr:YeeE/YedE family protein [Planctomycetota bacterium]